MAVGASSRAAQRTPARERRQVILPDVSGQFRVTTFLSLDAFALQYFSLDDHSATGKEGRMLRAFDVTTWAPRIWDEGVSGVFLDLRGAYNYWKRADDQAQLVFDCLVAWIGALEAERDPTDRFMNLGRILLRAFRMQLMMASDPGIRLSPNYCAPLFYNRCSTKTGLLREAAQPLRSARNPDALAMTTLSYLWTRGIYSNVRPRGNYSTIPHPSKNGRGAAARRS
ncbi:hypothetical protein TcYC6_0003680 [Trypanosoma cruzi]|nr:hypothetical protein TcYC6_0003680 [Trypanosoma cruzi]